MLLLTFCTFSVKAMGQIDIEDEQLSSADTTTNATILDNGKIHLPESMQMKSEITAKMPAGNVPAASRRRGCLLV